LFVKAFQGFQLADSAFPQGALRDLGVFWNRSAVGPGTARGNFFFRFPTL